MRVKDLVPGLNDVTVSGRILLTWPAQDFQRKDGTHGRVMRAILVDKTERVRCAIWDRHVDVLLHAGQLQGQVIRIGHAYTRQGLGGDTEVHAGDRSTIEVNPVDMPDLDLPEFGELFTPIGKLAVGANQVNAIGIVQNAPRFYSFTKEDRAGSVLRTIIADDSGRVPLVAWNERAEELRDLKSEAIVQALNARVRLDRNGATELHVESRSQIQVLETAPPFLKLPVIKTCKIAELSPNTAVNLTAAIFNIGSPQEIKRPSGEVTKVSRLLVSDNTGIVSVSLWDDKADLASGLKEGDTVEIAGASVRERQGEIMLSVGKSGRLQTIETKLEPAKEATKLRSLQQSKGLAIVEGTVADAPVVRQVVTERGENVDLASFTLRDDTAATRVTFWRDQAAIATKLRTGTRLRILGVRVRTGLNGNYELSSIPLTRLEFLEEREKDKPAWEDIRHVIALEPGLRTWIKGVVLEFLDEAKISFLCESCGSEIGFVQGQPKCEKCGTPRSGRVVLSTRLRLDDGTGVVTVLAARADADKLTILERNAVVNQMLQRNLTELVLERGQLLNLIGKEVEIHGMAQTSGAGEKLEFVADKIIPSSSS